jgi:hypothetical protein
MRIATRKAKRSVVRGLVSPAGWDADGNVVAVCIVSDQSVAHFIAPGGVGDEVRDHLRRFVCARGRVEKRAGLTYMQVETVVPVPDPDGPRDPD